MEGEPHAVAAARSDASRDGAGAFRRAIWYDATVAAGLLEASNSPVKGKNGYALAPVDKTKASGWLWSWALAIPKSSPDPTDAWKYIVSAARSRSASRSPPKRSSRSVVTAADATRKGKVGDPFTSPWRRRLPLLRS